MAEITEKITRECVKIANGLGNTYDEQQDTLQEGLSAVLEAKDCYTESWYVSCAKYRMRDYLRRERNLTNRYTENGDISDLPIESKIIRGFRGGKTPTVGENSNDSDSTIEG